MSNQLKAFLIAIPCLLLMMVIATSSSDEMQAIHRPEKAIDVEAERAQRNAITEQADLKARRAMTPEQKLRQEIEGITDLKCGPNYYGVEALQLTLTQKFPSSYGWFLMTIEGYTKAAYSIYPQIELLDIKINLSGYDSYGHPMVVPGLLYEMDKATFQKIEWKRYDLDNLPKHATRWDTLHHQLKP